jgi:sugar fermentation stimulation protein A
MWRTNSEKQEHERMRFAAPLIEARLIRRYKRFLADVAFPDGSEITVHVANPGAMTGLAMPGARVLLSRSTDAKRKLPLSWELVEADFGRGPEWVGVNTAHPNRLIAGALEAGMLPMFTGYERIRREVRYGERSRVDFQLESGTRPHCLLEIKNVHLVRAPGLAEFPDCVTARGARHLRELAAAASAGARAVLCYVVQVASVDGVAVAADIDPEYARAFADARAAGVEAAALACRVSPEGIEIDRAIPVMA